MGIDLKKLIGEKDVVKITRLIEEGELEETKEILMLQNRNGTSVAHWLADFHPTWTTDDPEILNLKDDKGETVRDVLKEKGKI